MKQLKKLTRTQKIRLSNFLKKDQKVTDVNKYGLVEDNKINFVVALRVNPGQTLTIPY